MTLDSVGFALEDFSSLRYLHAMAHKHQVGRHIHLESTPENIKNLFQMLDQQPTKAAHMRTASSPVSDATGTCMGPSLPR